MSYTIKAGDTLYEIAKAHDTTVAAIEKANPGINPKTLQVGQVIRLPGGGGPNPPKPPQDGNNNIVGAKGGRNNVGGEYVNYQGPASAYPPQDKWASYDALWKFNSGLIKNNASPQEIQWIKEAIETVSRSSRVDVRCILCIIVQESGGNPRVPTTNNGVRNPGLMQSHNGVEFNPAKPKESILQMIRDGSEGTQHGDGLKQLYKKYGNYYEAFRGYNSGSVNKGNLNDPVGATGDYVQKAANRLMGHVWPNQ